MHFSCSLRLDAGFAPDVEPLLCAAFAADGWEVREPGHYVFAVPAELGAVDGPSVKLGTALRNLFRERPGTDALPAALTCAYRDAPVFAYRVVVFPLPGNGAGLCLETGEEPLFADSIRLRDRMLSALLGVHRRR